ncbi:odorant receptor 46a-like [Prorops nasuta]|uniref:odorant receptor 46a-like n=1 Tax=Prorops nasuta TaxID=863751 RepID=UPI0034CEFB9F
MLVNNRSPQHRFYVNDAEGAWTYNYLSIAQMYFMFLIIGEFVLIVVLLVIYNTFHFLESSAIIRCRLKNIVGHRDNITKEEVKAINSSAHSTLITCIQFHSELLHGTRIFEDYFKNANIIELLGVLSIASFTIVQMMDYETMQIRTISTCFGELTLFGLLCVSGQKIIDTADSLSIAIDFRYQTEWYAYSNSSKKLILMMIHRANTPFLFANAIFAFTHQNLGMILKTIASYCTIINNLR